ncbi:hypothetical protein ACR3IL_11625 [Streptococcus iniae]|nr:hypothetical protein [Streptococcus iniae]
MQKKYMELDEKQLEQFVGGSNIFPDIRKGFKDLGDQVSGFLKGLTGF